MSKLDRSMTHFRAHISFALMAALLVVLWAAGGASRADVVGQVITRGGAWAILILFILFAPRPHLRPLASISAFIAAAIALVVIHLIPLPPSIWTELPGRGLLVDAATATGQSQPWRPLSISPDATINALSSLIVPVVTLLLLTNHSLSQHWRVATVLLGLVIASSLIALLQISGTRFDHPLINDARGMVSGSFANRNHFALFAAIGCLLAPAWAFQNGMRAHWRGLAALALILLFGLLILGAGSRTGMALGVLGVGIGLFAVRRQIWFEIRRLPKKGSVALVVGSLGLCAAAIILSISLDRAVSLDRALSLDIGEDLRRRALPTIVAVTQTYFPLGAGVGAFDPAYRIAEPDALLSPLYFNHAHNDLLEVVLEAGLPGLLLLSAAILWWLWRSFRVWRQAEHSQSLLARLGSGILLLTLIASITDYPARTPMIMAMVVIAAAWLNGNVPRDDAARSTALWSGESRSSRLASL